MPRLRIKIPGRSDETHFVSGPRVTIGRLPDNTIQILHPSVSAYHAEFVAAGDHFRLRDLGSTNHCFVSGAAVSEYHLREACELAFGSVECTFDPTPESAPPDLPLSPLQLGQEITFLRAENTDLREKNRALCSRVDILNSAQLFGEKRGSDRTTSSEETLRTLASERDALLRQTTELQSELEHAREELSVALRARDAARQSSGLLQAEKTSMLREIRATAVRSAIVQPG